MVFRDRIAAAEQLAESLKVYQKEHPLVLGIPRGAVPMAKTIADRIGGELDVVLVHKLGAPENPEFALGSISEFGTVFRSYGMAYYPLSPAELEQLASFELTRLKRRRTSYSPLRPPISPKDRTVIIVDDGIATGSTMIAAARAIRSQGARKVVVAAPVASTDAIELLKAEADDLVILDIPSDFYAISQFYEDFPQVEDSEVERILSEVGKSPGAPLAA